MESKYLKPIEEARRGRHRVLSCWYTKKAIAQQTTKLTASVKKTDFVKCFVFSGVRWVTSLAW